MTARRLVPRRRWLSQLALLGLAALLLLGALVVPPVASTQAAFSGSTVNANNSFAAQRIFSGTRTRSAFYVLDTSSSNDVVSSPTAYAGDGLALQTGIFAASYASNRYVDLQYASAVPANVPFDSATFNFTFSATRNMDTVCFYLEARRTSTGAVLGTYGGPGNDLGCQSAQTYGTVSVAIPAVTTSTQANDLTIRVFARNSAGNQGMRIDRATVTGNAYRSYVLFDTVLVDQATGTPTTHRWGIAAAGDGSTLTSRATWPASYSSSRYIEFTFPGFAPVGSVISTATFTHTFRSATSSTVCNYMEVYTGGTLIGSHGSASSDLACTNSAEVTTTRSLPEINTVDRANSVTIRLYFKSQNPSAASVHDLVTLGISYSLD